MMIKLSNKFAQLASTATLLLIGIVDDDVDAVINKYFNHKETMDITTSSLEILNQTLFEQFDIVLFSFTKESFDLYFQTHQSIPEHSIVLLTDELYLDFKSYLNLVFSTLLYPINEDLFLHKIYALLAIKEHENLLKTKEKILNKYKTDTVNDNIDTFLDRYSGSIMFINDDLNDNLNRLKNLEMSKEVFSNISINLIKLKNVLEHNKSLVTISSMLLEFSQFLDAIKFETIEPSRYIAFDYLTKIIEDITIYIDELFVYKLFKDTKLFEDSIANNIGYFEAQLLGLNDDSDIDNLEFF